MDANFTSGHAERYNKTKIFDGPEREIGAKSTSGSRIAVSSSVPHEDAFWCARATEVVEWDGRRQEVGKAMKLRVGK